MQAHEGPAALFRRDPARRDGDDREADGRRGAAARHEGHDLGTPATRAAIIETLLKQEYVRREKKALVATSKGIALITMLRSPLLTSAELTGQWEQKHWMVRGAYERETFMREVRAMVADLVAQIAGTTIAPLASSKGVQNSGAVPGLRVRSIARSAWRRARRLPHRACRGTRDASSPPSARGVRLHHRQAKECQAA